MSFTNGLSVPADGYGITATDPAPNAANPRADGLVYSGPPLDALGITFAAVAGTDVWSGPFRQDIATGLIRCFDASAALPAPVFYTQGLAFTVTGQLCTARGNAVTQWAAGWPLDARGALVLFPGGLLAPSAFTLNVPVPGQGGPNTIGVSWTPAALAAMYQIFLDGVEAINSPVTFSPVALTGVPNGAHTVAVKAVNSSGTTNSTPAQQTAQVGPAPATAWSTTDYGSSVGGTTAPTVTNGGRTIQGSNNPLVARANRSHSSGKFYFEIKIDVIGAFTGNNPFAGLCATGASLVPGASFIAVLINNPPNCSVYNAGNFFDVGPAMAVNNVCMFAVNWPLGVIFFGRNGAWYNGANPGNGTSTGAITGIPTGVVSPYVSLDTLATGQKVTGNFTAADLAFPAPAGFTPWGDG